MERKDLYKFLKERGYIYQTTNEEEIEKLITGKPTTIYMGVDPTADSLHIGHCFPLVVLRYFQEAGHKVVILIGGATSMIGDPSGRRDLRKMCTQEDLERNFSAIKACVEKFINFEGENPAILVNNYDWFKDQNYVSFMREIGVHFNVNKMLATDAYSTRIAEGGLTFFEMGYMLMQAYDFVYLNKNYGCTLQMGGSDQWANILAGADLGRKLALAEGVEASTMEAFTCPLLTTSEGVKMGKSQKGAIWVLKEKTSPYEFYQAFYNQRDEDVEHLFKVLTRLSLEEIEEIMKGDIRDAKHRMAYEVTKFVHGKDEADEAQKTVFQLFQNQNSGENAPTVEIDKGQAQIDVLSLFVASGLCSSKGEARRLAQQGGLSVEGEKVSDINKIYDINEVDGKLLKKGKKFFVRVVLK